MEEEKLNELKEVWNTFKWWEHVISILIIIICSYMLFGGGLIKLGKIGGLL